MPSLNEGMASRLYQWARDIRIVQVEGSWKSLDHQTKERWRELARRLHNYLGQASYPEGDFTVVPPGEYKVRPYTRRYTDAGQGEVGTADGAGKPAAGQGPADPDPGESELRQGTQDVHEVGGQAPPTAS